MITGRDIVAENISAQVSGSEFDVSQNTVFKCYKIDRIILSVRY